MVGKNNKQVLREKQANKFKRYALKKLTVGLASVTIGTGLAFATSSTVSADELAVGERTVVVSDKTAEEQPQPDTPYLQEQEEAVTSAEEPQVTEDRISEEKAVKTSEETEEKAIESEEVAEEKQADSHEQTEETSDIEETNTKAPQAPATQLAPVAESVAKPVREEQSAEAPTTTLSQIDQLPEEFLTYLRDHSDIVDFKNAATIETYANLLQQSYGVEAAKEERIRAIEAAVKEIETTKEQAKNEVVDQTERLIDADKDSTTPQDQSKETFKKAIQQADNPQIVVESYLKDAGYKAEDIAGILANVDMSLANDPDQLLDNIVQAGVKYANEHTQPGTFLVNQTDGENVGHLINVTPLNQQNPIRRGSNNTFDFSYHISFNNPKSNLKRVKPGDYFDVEYKNVTINDLNELGKTGGKSPIVRDQNGNVIAFITDLKEKNIIRYTFTEYVKDNDNIEMEIGYSHSIDRKKVAKNGTYDIEYKVGTNRFTLPNVRIDYSDLMAKKDQLNGSRAFVKVNSDGNYRHVTYFNPQKNSLNNVQIEGIALGTGTLNSENSTVKLYKVKDNRRLADSISANNYNDTTIFEDVTRNYPTLNQFEDVSFGGNPGKSTGRAHLGNINETYVMVVDSKTKGEGTILAGSILYGNGKSLQLASSTAHVSGAGAAQALPRERIYSIGDHVWHDENKDGIQQPGEPGIANVEVRLLDNSGEIVSTTRTDSEGHYEFNELPNGQYFVEFSTPEGFIPTIKNVNNNRNDANDSDGTIVPVTINNRSDMTIDSGFYRKVYSIGDKVWVDSDKDGIQDTGERGLAGVTVKLVDEYGNVKTTTTKPNGEYRFDNLDEGTYQVIFQTPEGYEPTKPYQGDNRNQDSNGSTTTIKVSPQNPFFNENRHNPTVDFGLIEVQPEKLYEMTVEDSSFETHIYSEEEYNKLPGKTSQTVEAGKIKKVQSGKDRRVQVLYEHVNPDTLPESTTKQFVDGFVNGTLVTEAGTFVQRNGKYWREVSRQVLQESQDEIFIYKPVKSKDPVIPRFNIEDGKLYVTINGNKQEIGNVTGEPGEPGKIPTFEINEDGHLIAKVENEPDKDLGKVKGEPGAPGQNGNPGKDGQSVTVDRTETDGDGNTVVHFSDGSSATIAKGAKGDKGEDGADGHTPEIGENGNWIINGVDTEKPARGADGQSVTVDRTETDGDGNTVVHFSDGSSATIAKGAKGDKGEDGADGHTPTIGENGNWFINGV
uniref:SdrD B-like domain-containing protein n=1 Tax=Dolosigranulum pigrum TaxID=29394 RepID=UPI00248CC03A